MNHVSILGLAVFSSLIFGVIAYSDTIKCSNGSAILTISGLDGWQGQPATSVQVGQLQFGLPKVIGFSASLTKHSGLILIDFIFGIGIQKKMQLAKKCLKLFSQNLTALFSRQSY